MAILEASNEGIWIKNFITKLGVVPSVLDPMVIYCDNSGAMLMSVVPF
jgi:hypothetical protein